MTHGRYDVAIAGAGILGLAHAYHLAQRGRRVIVFERGLRAQGASVRNFGMIWPIGQPAGPRYDLALRSRNIWHALLKDTGLWHDTAGCLHLAYHDDEARVLREFIESVADEARPYELLTPHEVTQHVPAVNPAGLQLGLKSAVEICVDPRQVVAELPNHLHTRFGVQFEFDTAVRSFEEGVVRTTRGDWSAPRLIACTGADFREVAPEAFAEIGLVPCKLQMMRTTPHADSRIGTMVAAGLTLAHYQSFQCCPTLPALKARLAREFPEQVAFGIHVLVSQNGHGEITLGDSHEYGAAIEPFDKTRIDDLVLDSLRRFLTVPNLTIASRWHGVYVKHPEQAFVVATPRPGLLCVTGVGGAGMTLSFGLAEQTLLNWWPHD
jgi:FAD dependent oxidoreductase TIGR03364